MRVDEEGREGVGEEGRERVEREHQGDICSPIFTRVDSCLTCLPPDGHHPDHEQGQYDDQAHDSGAGHAGPHRSVSGQWPVYLCN